jgi:hypothetical protein
MTPKEKADELIDNFDATLTYLESKTKVKQCALIAVNEIIHSMPTYPQSSNSKMKRLDTITFWMLVKEEIKTYGGNK